MLLLHEQTPKDINAEADEIAALLNLSIKKPKSKPKSKPKPIVDSDANENLQNIVKNENTDFITELDPPTYEYSQLLDRMVDILHSRDPAWAEKRRQTLKAPQMMRGNHKLSQYQLYSYLLIITLQSVLRKQYGQIFRKFAK